LKTSREERRSSSIQNQFNANKTYNFIFGFILLYVFWASTFYHASLTSLAHKFDYSAVFSFVLFPVMFFSHRWWLIWRNKPPHTQKRGLTVGFISTFLIANVVLTFLMPKGKESVAVLILILIFFGYAFITAIVEQDNPKLNYLILSIVSVLLALVGFEFDKYKVLCNPDSYFQPHSLWNVFIGISAFYFFLYMRSEHKLAGLIYKDIIK
jgi:cation transport ATPase